MENKDIASVPYFFFEEVQDAHEKEIERLEKDKERLMKINKRFLIVIIALILLIAGGITGILIYESQFDKVSYSQDGEGVNNVNIGDQGDVNYEPESNG